MKSFSEYQEQKAVERLARTIVECRIDPYEFCDNILESYVKNEGFFGKMGAGLAGAAKNFGQNYKAGARGYGYDQAVKAVQGLQQQLQQLGYPFDPSIEKVFTDLQKGLETQKNNPQQQQQQPGRQPPPLNPQGQAVPQALPDGTLEEVPEGEIPNAAPVNPAATPAGNPPAAGTSNGYSQQQAGMNGAAAAALGTGQDMAGAGQPDPRATTDPGFDPNDPLAHYRNGNNRSQG